MQGSESRWGIWPYATLLLLSGCGETSKAAPAAPPPPTVLVAPVAKRDVTIDIESVGTLDGYVNADIRARVRGFLQSQNYKDGAYVKEGQLLFTIDSSEYVTAIQSAKATLARAEAGQTHNKAQLERYEVLGPAGTVSKQEVENAQASNADSQGAVLAARAALRQAELNLGYTQMRAPVSGIAGVASVRVGNLVGQEGPTLLTTVSQLDPVRVNFPLSEVDYVQSPGGLKNLEKRDVAWAKAQFPKLDKGEPTEDGDTGVQLILADGSVYPHRGVIVTANRQVDATTGTILMQALFPNTDSRLRPGQYARVKVPRSEAGKDALLVPEKALISVQGSYSVAVVGNDNKVSLRRVELGPIAGQGIRVVRNGVSEGDKIVVEGTQKVTDGATVVPQPAPPASAQAAPGAAPPPSAATAPAASAAPAEKAASPASH
ncbi:RND efflux system, membrane fusion protein CmeA [Labilithrix luteola]|uniref:RND efflux system, membrane fusion protein CmeA n=1 Tax=Labilithrix luteola TaxID=1391654 RepID=A0A0K1QD09_9BACT|nr:efflux RND transporter periplasmic adaptor subunit [Labilithrix luteola]AKV03634.1 RND efflux system, membrane fusion protein CmeA [Labilithrix luteola]